MDSEEWRPIPGWDRYYEASSLGRIRSIERLSRVNSVHPERKRKMGGKIRKYTPQKGGYLYVTLTAAGVRFTHMVHHFVLLAFRGAPGTDQVCRHLDGNPANNKIENLKWGTHLENMQDRKAHGRYPSGSKHPMAKLTPEQVREIKTSPEHGYRIARRFGVGATQVSRIRRGESWVE